MQTRDARIHLHSIRMSRTCSTSNFRDFLISSLSESTQTELLKSMAMHFSDLLFSPCLQKQLSFEA